MRLNSRILAYELLVLAIGCLATTAITVALYRRTVSILETSLRQRLESIVRTAAPLIDPHDLDQLRVEKDWHKPVWAKVVHQIERVRLNNPKILFVYVFRRSGSGANSLEFVADSHSINPYAPIDLNGDGRIDAADQLQWPGQPYEDPPSTAYEGFHSVVTSNLYTDQWGSELSGYAPIVDSGTTVAVLAVDIKADDFATLTHQTLIPFLLFIATLVVVILILGAATAIIWQKRVWELAAIDRQKDELLGIVSHQLGSPIASLRWCLKDMLDGEIGPLSTDQRGYVQNLVRSTDTLSELTALLLDVSRIELGRMKMSKQKLDAHAFLTEVAGSAAEFAKEKGVTFETDLPTTLPEAFLDPRLTRMTLENLLMNAVKYTPLGGTVRLAAEARGESLVCTVRDTGVGIPKQDQPHIFDKLYRASNVQTIEGNGFGLYVAKGACEQQGGSIAFRSYSGQGTEFTVTLPLRHA